MLSWRKIREKYPYFTVYEVSALAIVLVAIGVRVALTVLGWPLLDSDEGTMGLMGMHIAFRGEHPIFFYGQGYMGAGEAYLAALFFQLFGVSSFTLRLGLILIYTIFLVTMYLLTSLLYSKKLALFILVLLTLGSNALLTRELVAVGGDPETLMCGALIVLLTAWLALTSQPDVESASSSPSSVAPLVGLGEGGEAGPPEAHSHRGQHNKGSSYSAFGKRFQRNQWRRLLAYTVWGLTAGFALFSHMLSLPLILLGGLILLLFCWRDLLSWAPILLLAALLLGAYPIIAYNLSAPPNRGTLFYVLNAMAASNAPFSLLHQIKGAFLITLPIATGANPLCPTQDVHALHLGSIYALRCTLVHTGWSLGVMGLWALAVLLAAQALWRLRPAWLFAGRVGGAVSSKHGWPPQERQDFIRHSIGLALLVSCALTLALYVMSPNAALYPVATSRYLISFLIATPSLLWPLWQGAQMTKPLVLKFASNLAMTMRFTRVGSRIVLTFIGLIFLLGTFTTFTGIPATPAPLPGEDVYFTQGSTQYLNVPATRALNTQESLLIHGLLRMGLKHIYSDYWTCDRIIFQSREDIFCSALKERLEPGHNRYFPYRDAVKADPNAAYVFHADSLPDKTFEQRIVAPNSPFQHYQRQILYGYAVYYKSQPYEARYRQK